VHPEIGVAYDEGVTFFDKAEAYSPYENETVVGQRWPRVLALSAWITWIVNDRFMRTCVRSFPWFKISPFRAIRNQ
jgi:hypothetical protein